MEILCVVLGFIFVLSSTHICHYCLFTKKDVKRKGSERCTVGNGETGKGQSSRVLELGPRGGLTHSRSLKLRTDIIYSDRIIARM